VPLPKAPALYFQWRHPLTTNTVCLFLCCKAQATSLSELHFTAVLSCHTPLDLSWDQQMQAKFKTPLDVMLFMKDFMLRPKSPHLPVFQTVNEFLLPCIPQFLKRWERGRNSIRDASDIQKKNSSPTNPYTNPRSSGSNIYILHCSHSATKKLS